MAGTWARGIEVVVLDILGTMVDEPGGLRAALREAVPDADETDVDRLLAVWQEHVEQEQQRIREGDRAYATTDVVDREAAQRVAAGAGLTDPATLERLATAGQRLSPWPDSADGLARLSRHLPVLGLSNAGRASLLRLNAHAGLRWHQALSAEDARSYKPAPEVYRLAVDAADCPPERMLMVATHAWDLRAAQSAGMRTAYVRRPGGDPPRSTDTFDLRRESLDELATELTARPAARTAVDKAEQRSVYYSERRSAFTARRSADADAPDRRLPLPDRPRRTGRAAGAFEGKSAS